jgi:uncharacterized protein YjbI with pentapeptide repeats
MSNSWRHVAALLWLLTIPALALALLSKSAAPGPPAQQGSIKSPFLRCTPEKPDKCVSEQKCLGRKRALGQPQFEELLRNHREWLKLTDAHQPIAHPEWKADLANTDLRRMELANLDLRYADLTCAELSNADLTGAKLQRAAIACGDLQSADLKGANLSGADLTRAALCNANLYQTRLDDSTLTGANLSDASLWSAKMQYAYMGFSSVSGAHFDVDPSSLPQAESFQWVEDLELVRLGLGFSPGGLFRLRDQLRSIGLRDQQKDVTVALRRAEMARPTHSQLERDFNWLMFDATCEYGKDSGRALKLLGFCFLAFAVIYVFAQMIPSHRSGIWAVWDKDRIHKTDGLPEDTMRLTDGFPPTLYTRTALGRLCDDLGLRILGLALWFSLLSATQIGWQAFNFGTWFSRMQPREYGLRATGWVRVAAGIQSLISVYFVALWILTYFGTPFE